MFVADEVIVRCFDDDAVAFVACVSISVFDSDHRAVTYTMNGWSLGHDNVDSSVSSLSLVSKKIFTGMKSRAAKFACDESVLEYELYIAYGVWCIEWMIEDVLMELLCINVGKALDKIWL